jgi:hypothetical protein
MFHRCVTWFSSVKKLISHTRIDDFLAFCFQVQPFRNILAFFFCSFYFLYCKPQNLLLFVTVSLEKIQLLQGVLFPSICSPLYAIYLTLKYLVFFKLLKFILSQMVIIIIVLTFSRVSKILFQLAFGCNGGSFTVWLHYVGCSSFSLRLIMILGSFNWLPRGWFVTHYI